MPLPYSITNECGAATFIADNQALYKAFFLGIPVVDAPQIEGFVVDFSFERDVSNCKLASCRDRYGEFKKLVGRTDERIKATLIKVADDFFEANPFFVVYFTCDSTDGKQRGRLQMFNEWHEAHKEQFEKIPFNIRGVTVDGEKVQGETVGGVIFRKEHPHQAIIENYVASEVIAYNRVKSPD